MASIRVHQDIANFERRRKGFTTRQLVLMVAAVVVFAALIALFCNVLGLELIWGVYIALIPALLLLLAAFLKVANMNFEDFFSYFFAHFRRGRVIFYKPTSLLLYPVSGDLDANEVLVIDVIDDIENAQSIDVISDCKNKRGGDNNNDRAEAKKYLKECQKPGFECRR